MGASDSKPKPAATVATASAASAAPVASSNAGGGSDAPAYPDPVTQLMLSWGPNGKLASIPASAFSDENKRNVTSLILDFNALTELPNDLAARLPLLTELSLASNLLRAVPDGGRVFGSTLTTLILGGNRLTNSDEFDRALTPLSALTELNLSSNQFTHIPPPIAGLRALTSLSVAQNQISHLRAIHAADEKVASRFALIDSESLPIGTLPVSLRKLNLSANAFTELTGDGWLHAVPALTFLDASENRLTALPHALTQLTQLKQLTVAANRLTELPVPDPQSAGWPALLRIDISCNRFVSVPLRSLSRTKGLTVVEMNGNPLAAPAPAPATATATATAASADTKTAAAPAATAVPVASASAAAADSKSAPAAAVTAAAPRMRDQSGVDALQRLYPKCRISAEYVLPDLIVPRVYLGCYAGCARNESGLRELCGVTHVLTVAYYRPLFPDSFTYDVIEVDDNDLEDLHSYMNRAANFIESALAANPKNAVFVHCRHGVSRSATMLTAYLMKSKRMKFEAAFEVVKRGRSRVGPNDGFKNQLRKYERELFPDSAAAAAAPASAAVDSKAAL